MAIRVFVKRKVAESDIEALRGYIDKLRVITTGQPGYISGETLRRLDRPGEILVISKWKTQKEWQRWFESEKRGGVQRQIDELTSGQTTYEIYDFD